MLLESVKAASTSKKKGSFTGGGEQTLLFCCNWGRGSKGTGLAIAPLVYMSIESLLQTNFKALHVGFLGLVVPVCCLGLCRWPLVSEFHLAQAAMGCTRMFQSEDLLENFFIATTLCARGL